MLDHERQLVKIHFQMKQATLSAWPRCSALLVMGCVIHSPFIGDLCLATGSRSAMSSRSTQTNSTTPNISALRSGTKSYERDEHMKISFELKTCQKENNSDNKPAFGSRFCPELNVDQVKLVSCVLDATNSRSSQANLECLHMTGEYEPHTKRGFEVPSPQYIKANEYTY